MALDNLVGICVLPFGGPESVRPNGLVKPLEYGEQFKAANSDRLAELISKGRAVAPEHFAAHDAERKAAEARLKAADKAQIDVRARVNALMAQASTPAPASNTAPATVNDVDTTPQAPVETTTEDAENVVEDSNTTPAAQTTEDAAPATTEAYDISKTVKDVLADVKNDVISAYDALQLELTKGSDSRTTLVTELQDIIDADKVYDVASKNLDQILADVDAGVITAVDAASLEQARAGEARQDVIDMLAALLEAV